MTSSEELRFTKIKQLPAISDINDNDIFIIENNTATYKISGAAITQYIKNHPDIKNTYVESSDIGIENGIVPLDSNKKIDSVYLVFGKTSGNIYDGADGALLEEQFKDHTKDSGNPHQVNKAQVGLDQAENKSSETIRSEITSKNVTDALGYTPELSGAYENSVAYTDKKINDLIGSASGAADTLKELEDLIANNKDLLETLNSAITQKVDYKEYNSHVSNQIIHCTQSEKDDITASLAHVKSPHAREDATKTSASSINGNLKINDSEVSIYQHPLSGAIQGTYTSVTVDTNGHVTVGSNPTVPITRGGTGAASASGALINLGLTATASEINKLDGVSVSTTEINHLSGSTKNIQAQLNGKADLSHGNHVPDISAETKAKFLSNDGAKSNWHALTANDISTALGYVPGTGSNILTAVKGAVESEYQTGNVNITPEKIGLGKVDNTKDSEKSVLSASKLQIARSIDGVSFNGTSNITHYGVCSTTATDPDKIVSCPGFELVTGASIKIKFNNTNTAEHPTLNINHSGAIPVTYTGIGKDITTMWNSGEVIDLIFDGTQYLIADSGLASVREYGITKLTDGVASTSTDTAATPASVKKTYDLAADAVDLISLHKSGSDHDDRYYTESEINNLLAGKLSTSASCNKNWNWSGQSGQPTWVWGSSDGTNMYVYNPSNFNVANAGFASLAGAVAWDKVTNKPASYPPSPHTHDYLPAAGGIIAGNLQINGGISSNSYYTKDPNATMKIVATNYINLQANGSIQARNHDDTGWVGMSALGFYNQSSQRYKEHIQDMSEETAKEILQLRPVTYDYKNKNDGTNCLGLIAEEVAQIEKYPVSYNADGEVDGLDYSKFIPQLIKMVQMMQKEIDELKKQIN